MVYGEARNQGFSGQVAVAAVAVNRSLDGRWPVELCAVVRQARQFTGYWAAPAKSWNSPAWNRAYLAAGYATEGYTQLPQSYRDVRYFQSGNTSGFHSSLIAKGKIGAHIFYR